MRLVNYYYMCIPVGKEDFSSARLYFLNLGQYSEIIKISPLVFLLHLWDITAKANLSCHYMVLTAPWILFQITN
jgi:hypothetical protein